MPRLQNFFANILTWSTASSEKLFKEHNLKSAPHLFASWLLEDMEELN
jgi:hypothetical protein